MNNTNRALNRIGIFLFGFVLLVLGGGVAVAAAVPDWLASWRDGAKNVAGSTTDVIKGTPLGNTGQSWLLLVVAIVAVVLIALLLVFIFRQGHGRSGTLLTRKATGSDTSAAGSIMVSSVVAERSIAVALKNYTGIASSSVSTYAVRGVATMQITVSARRGVSPRDIRDYIDQLVRRWDQVLGAETPVFIKINGGFASRVSKPNRLPERATA
ncbi:hypothetical protein [Glaciihabitans sp. UYNi722]|uniref:hypothetical protein n=1 Tax=Glaciihabitans sp. UYNi722 TaxID=3156344 RepID=UPI003392C52B